MPECPTDNRRHKVHSSEANKEFSSNQKHYHQTILTDAHAGPDTTENIYSVSATPQHLTGSETTARTRSMLSWAYCAYHNYHNGTKLEERDKYQNLKIFYIVVIIL